MPRNTFARQALHHARVASTAAQPRPAYAAGIRGALATVVPLLVDRWLGLGGGAGSWLSLAGLNGSLGDRGGPYQTRAATMTVLALASAAAALLAVAVGGHLWLAVPVTFTVAFVCGLARVWPDVGPGFGVAILVTFAISLAVPTGSMSAGLMRGLWIAVGGSWAMLIAIVLWPLRPYRPVRLGVAACYRALADYLDDVSRHTTPEQRRATGEYKAHVVSVRAAIETARSALAISRRGRSSETGRGERLLILHEIADQLYAHLIALDDIVEALPPETVTAAARNALTATLRDVATTTRSIGAGIENEDDSSPPDVRWGGDSVRDVAVLRDGVYTDQIAALLDRMYDYAAAAASTVATLNSGRGGSDTGDPEDVVGVGDLRPPRAPLFSLQAIAHADSVVLQHALRVAIVTSVAVLITGLLHLNHGYWVTLTAVVILQPYSGATHQKALQRVLGTILGGVVAAALSALFHSFGAVIILVGLFTFLCVALLPVNYGAYAIFGTPAFVLLAEASVGDWHLSGIRIINTVIGGVLALIGSRVLWPSAEWNRLPDYTSAALRANRELLRLAVEVATSEGDPAIGVLRDARRNIALAASNAEESFQRLVGEHTGPAERLEPIMAFLVYTRRFAASTAALAIAAQAGDQAAPDVVLPFALTADRILDDLADAVTHGRPPAPFPAVGVVPMPDEGTPPAIRMRINRLARQLRMLHDSITRWLAPAT
jgi:uncharacterized membrane protein YccC